MKAKLLKLLRLIGCIPPFFIGVLEKLALGLIKKLTGFTQWARGYLDRVKAVCDDPVAIVEGFYESEPPIRSEEV